jgi:hypothetical protein
VTTTVDAELPTMGVTYETPDANFAALVTENHDTRLRVWLYSFWDTPTEITLKFWRLRPGEYLVTQGQLYPGEHPFQHRYGWDDPQPFKVLHRAEPLTITLRPQTVWVVDVRLDREVHVPRVAPDPAIAPRDVRVSDGMVTATIHNMGTAAARNVRAVVQTRRGTRWVAVGQKEIASLPVSRDYQPASVEIPLVPADQLTGEARIVLDAGEYELNASNNIAPIGR